MRELRKTFCQQISVKYSIFCATLGLALALLLVILLVASDVGAGNVRAAFSPNKFLNESVIAITTLYASAFILGKVAGKIICRIEIHNQRIRLIGIGLAWSCLFLSVLSASSINFFREMYKETSVANAFVDYIFKPLFWFVFFGWFPALLLGLFYAQRVKAALVEVE